MTRRRATEDEAPAAQPVRGESLLTKYRPRRLRDVIGQDAIVKSLEAALKDPAMPHCVLFTGPPGTGKTTLARIVASECDVGPEGFIERDGATCTGIDDVRELKAGLRYSGFGSSPNKAVIIDECHRLSKQAWDSLLKDVEEPPPHVYFFFCTTEPDKVPAAIATRGLAYALKPVKLDDLMDLVEDTAKAEGYKLAPGFLQMIAEAAAGSPRRALGGLAKVAHCEDKDEAAELLEAPDDNPEVIDLCRALVKGELEWPELTAKLKALGAEFPAESIRLVIVNYLNACILGSRREKDTPRLLGMLECFMKPCNPSEKLAGLLVAFGRWIYP